MSSVADIGTPVHHNVEFSVQGFMSTLIVLAAEELRVMIGQEARADSCCNLVVTCEAPVECLQHSMRYSFHIRTYPVSQL